MEFLETDTLGQERFSLLLLEPGEIYFEDFSVYYFPDGDLDNPAPNRQQQGHLKVCSKSVVFVPKQIQWPIIKFPMRNVEKIEEHEPGLLSKAANALRIATSQHVEMKAKNIVAPFVFKKVKKAHLFTLNYASVDDALGPMCQIHRASTLTCADQEVMLQQSCWPRTTWRLCAQQRAICYGPLQIPPRSQG
ncbi:protein FAN-like [Babylonia areolata]|uniref:protein FAN-like n=1 Tax=Babylonia areolata TaxID=304850 RepID=UPI003FD0126C